MSWQKTSEDTKAFHENNLIQESWTVITTSETLGISVKQVHEDLVLAEVANDPEYKTLSRQEALAKAKNINHITNERILADCIKLALVTLGDPISIEKGVKARAILRYSWKLYQQRLENDRRPKKAS